jgi:hypothetical protein
MIRLIPKKNKSFYKKYWIRFLRIVKKLKKLYLYFTKIYLRKIKLIKKIFKKINKFVFFQYKYTKKYLKIETYSNVVSMSFAFMLCVSLLGVQYTNSFYHDNEISDSSVFHTGLLDFQLTNNNLNKIIGPEALGEISHVSVVIPESNSLPMQYDLDTSVDVVTSNSDFCNGLIVEAKNNGITKYNGPFNGLFNTTTTEFGSWEFRFDLPPNIFIPNGAQCNASILFSAWRADIVNKTDSSWHDEEVVNVSLTARMVVLNEIYARPNSVVVPKDREYIELYNNGNTPVDVLGWSISEIAGSTEIFYPIVATGAVPGEVMPYNGASTIISAGGFLVLEFGGTASHLNDTGDTVKLYDSATILLDSHVYSALVAGKSVVRFPDGIGFWVDPEPTPGRMNMVSLEDLNLAGFNDVMIEEVLNLMNIKNITLTNYITDKEERAPEITTDEKVNEPEEEVPIIPELDSLVDEPKDDTRENVEESILEEVIIPEKELMPSMSTEDVVLLEVPVAVEPAPVEEVIVEITVSE